MLLMTSRSAEPVHTRGSGRIEMGVLLGVLFSGRGKMRKVDGDGVGVGVEQCFGGMDLNGSSRVVAHLLRWWLLESWTCNSRYNKYYGFPAMGKAAQVSL